MLNRFANPARFMRLSGAALPWCAWLTLAALAIGLYLALFVAPPDYQQGEACASCSSMFRRRGWR